MTPNPTAAAAGRGFAAPDAPELEQAIVRGLAYLHQHQYPNGQFCAYRATDASMQGWLEPDSVIFPAALIAGSLLFLAESPQADEILTRATRFFQGEMRYGLWNHFTRSHPWSQLCPLDVDDTSCVSAVLRGRGVDNPSSSNVSLLLANRDRRGLFYTWFLLRPRWSRHRTYWRIALQELRRPIQSFVFWRNVEAHRHDVDGVVNANVLYYLGDRPEMRPVIAYLLRIIAEGKETDCDLWYRDAAIVYYFFSRPYFNGITALEPARQPVIDRIRASARPDGRLGETLLDTALSVCALLNWRATLPELGSAIRFLLAAQQETGEWPRWLVYYGGPKKLMGWGSEELTTGFCLEALARYGTAAKAEQISF